MLLVVEAGLVELLALMPSFMELLLVAVLVELMAAALEATIVLVPLMQGLMARLAQSVSSGPATLAHSHQLAQVIYEFVH
jgi:hypothetical protein